MAHAAARSHEIFDMVFGGGALNNRGTFSMLTRTLTTLLTAIFAPITAAAQDAPTPVHAPQHIATDTVTLDFASMPENLKLVYADENGGWIEVFKGKSGDRYLMERQFPDGTLDYLGYYNIDGHLIARHYSSGNIRTFSPHHCERVVGECRFRFWNTEGSEGTLHVLTERDDDTYITAFWELDFAKTYLSFVPGEYNIAQSGISPRGIAFELVEMSVQH
ncbi:hypothetical protein [Shimia sp. MMG029]|uniref:hypothetical protein n=1 Tax=Shimia sp. MMG029 TaxID=3021978 RepID=UPI0022FEA1C1|nr:hypothetical protein [Shimia sp. MMG029]MDA5556443.1 hypothetical protein [Shimia sp. MMG029]